MIGIFDSGHGGLTVLRAMVDRLPDRSFTYYGDHKHIPYGDRPSAEIVAFTRAAVELLFLRGCRLVILACNTAAAVALRTLQRDWLPTRYPDRRILGVLVPTVEAICNAPWSPGGQSVMPASPPRTIALFATRRTVASNAYPEEIRKRAPAVAIVQHACAGLVDLIEAGATRPVLQAAIRAHVNQMLIALGDRPLDAVLLGCTHYPLVDDLFAESLPVGTQILSQPELVAQSLADYLTRHPELDSARAPRQLFFLTSGDVEHVNTLATLYFGRAARFIDDEA